MIKMQHKIAFLKIETLGVIKNDFFLTQLNVKS